MARNDGHHAAVNMLLFAFRFGPSYEIDQLLVEIIVNVQKIACTRSNRVQNCSAIVYRRNNHQLDVIIHGGSYLAKDVDVSRFDVLSGKKEKTVEFGDSLGLGTDGFNSGYVGCRTVDRQMP